MSDRIPCITPGCRRTAPADKYEDGSEIICAKCFRLLPEDVRKEHRECWKHVRKWSRKATRLTDPRKIGIAKRALWRAQRRLMRNWSRIRQIVTDPDSPSGIDNFMKEAGIE